MIKFYQLTRLYLAVFLMLGAVCAFAQEKAVTGKVTASDGTTVPGVNILEKGTSNGTVSDADGNFKINVGSNATLVFSFIGFKTQEIPVGSQTNINPVMETDVTSLAEVVVVGYGMQEKKDVTGAIVATGTKDFNRGIMSSPQDMMQGKVAGVQIVQNDGAPGAGSTIRIRGAVSALGSSDPLIVIDGFPVDNSSSSTIPGVSNPLVLLNPNDIETFTVLKDASATAIYGLRASAGVIIITTKKGKEGKLEVGYNAQVSVSTPAKYFPVLSGDEMRATANAELAAGLPGLTASSVKRLGTTNTDWQKQVFQNAVSQDHNISLAGSLVKNLPFRASVGYTDQEGLLKTTNMKRTSVNLNLTPSFLDGDLQVTASLKGMNTQQNFGNTNALGAATSFDPTQPVYNPASTKWGGFFTWVGTSDTLANGTMNPNGNPITIGAANPVALVKQTSNQSNVYRGLASLKLDYRLKFFPAIKVTMNAGLDYSTSNGYNNNPNNAAFTYGAGGGQKINYAGQNKSRLFDLYANYVKDLGKSRFDVTAGYSYQAFEITSYSLQRNGQTPPIYTNSQERLNAQGQPILGSDGNPIQDAYVAVPQLNYLLSFFGRANYSYADKYLLTISARDDASSRFAKQNRFVIFPSAAVGWRINKESFMAGASFISDLKLRGSYGITGNQNINLPVGAQNGSYPYLPLYQISNPQAQYQFGNAFVNTQRPQAYDANLKWETTAQTDVGLDFGFFNNRITGQLDLYQKKTSNLINFIPVPLGSNFSNYLYTNVGDLQNRGIEFMIKAVAVKTNDFEWNIGFNISHNENKITKLLKTDDPTYSGIFVGGISGGVGTTIQDIQVGAPINSFFVFKQVYNAQGAPVEGLYVDKSGQGGQVIANNQNKYLFHSPQAQYLMGINTRLTYKHWDFYAQGRISTGNYVYNNNQSSKAFYASMYNQAGFFNNLPSGISDTKFVQPQYYSSYYVQNASFFKMDNLSLGYSVSQLLDTKLRARFSFTVNNAFWITKYKGQDPDVLNGIDNNIYPRPRIFVVGLNFTY